MSAGPAISPARYNKIELKKEGKDPIELNAGTISVNYYESLYSPTVTAVITFVDAGGNIEDKKESTFKVNRCPVIAREANRHVVMLDLISKQEKSNDDLPIFDKFKGKISDTVKKLLTEKLEVTQDKIEVDETENNYNFTGRGRGVLNIIRELCKRSIPPKGDAGYFFYQTKSAFKYKAIDELIKQEPKTKVFYTGPLKSDMETQSEANDFKILTDYENKHGFVEASKDKNGNVKKFFFLGPQNKWEEILDNKTRSSIEKSFKDEMQELKYL